jgi:hypothetical protein
MYGYQHIIQYTAIFLPVPLPGLIVLTKYIPGGNAGIANETLPDPATCPFYWFTI